MLKNFRNQMKYFKNFDVVLFGTFKGTFGEQIRSVAHPFSFDNHLKTILFFGRIRPKKDRFWQQNLRNHVKNIKSSPNMNIFSYFGDNLPTNNLYY